MRALLILLIFLSSSYCVQAQKTPIRLIARYSNYYKYGTKTGVDSSYWNYSGRRGSVDELNNVFDVNTVNTWDTLGNYYQTIITSTFDANDSILSTVREEYRLNVLSAKYSTLFYYDAKSNHSETSYSGWYNNSWLNQSRVLNSFDTMNRLYQITNQTFSGTQWRSDNRTTYTYLNNTKKITSKTTEQNSFIGLQNRSQNLYSYDQNGNMILESYSQYDSSTWKKQYYIEYGYDGNNRNIWTSRYPMTMFHIKDSSSTFYDVNGNVTSSLGFEYNTLKALWTNGTKNEYTYNANNNILTQLTSNGDSAGWIAYNLQKHEYNPHNFESQIIFFAFKNGLWDTINKRNMTYDNRDNLLEIETTFWLNGQRNSKRYENRTFNQFDLVSTLKFSSNTQGNTEKDNDFTFIYDTNQYPLNVYNVNLKNITTYPNPFSNSFSIQYESNIAGNISMHLYDIKGRLITKTYSTANIGENTIIWDCGRTLPSGTYIYELHIGQDVFRGKILSR